MLNFPYFGHGLIKTYNIAFGALFSNVWIQRRSRAGAELAYFKVPLTYGSKDKMLIQTQQDPSIQKPSAIDLPMMSFEYNIVGYDSERKLNKTNTIIGGRSNTGGVLTTLNPVPYNIAFQLYAYVKFEEDGQKIVEQILPFFTPDLTLQMTLVPELNEAGIRDIPIILNGVNMEDRFEGPPIDRQVKIWTFTFTMQAYLFGPTVDRPTIKFVNFNYIPYGGNTSLVTENDMRIIFTTQPGLDANGNPTSNVSISIDPHLINFDDNFGYVFIVEDPTINAGEPHAHYNPPMFSGPSQTQILQDFLYTLRGGLPDSTTLDALTGDLEGTVT